MLCQSGVSVCRDGRSYERLQDLRSLYEGYAEALGEYLNMPLPPWIPTEKHKDNWLTVAKVRAKTEAANSPTEENARAAEMTEAAAALIDHHHDF